MESQQVQLTRIHYVDEIPEEVERLFRKSATSFSHAIGDPLIELTNLLEQKNYVVFLEKLHVFREQLGRADMLLQDCDGIIKSYVSLVTQDDNQQQEKQQSPSAPNMDFESLLGNMKDQAEKLQNLQNNLEKNNVQEG